MAGPRRIAGLQPFAELARRPTTVVYKAYAPEADRFVLLKVLRPEFAHDAALVEEFTEEARLLARVDHPNVVATHSFGQEEGSVYLASEFVEGVDVAALLAEHGPLPPELAAFVLCETARGLAAAHAEGILHRDLKPANVLVATDGRVKLADFGLASLAEAAGEDSQVRGTLAYLSPEQVLGQNATPAADLFALGAMFFELLTGTSAFGGGTYSDVLDAILHHDPLPFLRTTTDLPEPVYAICARLLAKDPAARYPDAVALVEALEALGGSADAVAMAAYVHDPAGYRAARRAERLAAADRASRSPARARSPIRRVGLALVAVLVLLGLGYGGLRWLGAAQAAETAPPPTQASLHFGEWLTLHRLDSAQVAAGLPAPAEAPPPVAEAPPSAPAGFGTLRIESRPWANVYIDGQPVGTTPFDAPLVLAPGEHEVVLRHPEFPEHQARVTVEPAAQAALSVSLWERVGALTLEVSPWAEVLVDGVVRDTVPPQRRPLVVAPGKHLLSLRHPGLGTVNYPFEIQAGEQQTLRFNLHEQLGQ